MQAAITRLKEELSVNLKVNPTERRITIILEGLSCLIQYILRTHATLCAFHYDMLIAFVRAEKDTRFDYIILHTKTYANNVLCIIEYRIDARDTRKQTTRLETLSCSSRVVSCACRSACRCSSSAAADSRAASSVSSLPTSVRFSDRSVSSADTASSPLFSAMLFASDSTCALSASSRAPPSRILVSSSYTIERRKETNKLRDMDLLVSWINWMHTVRRASN